MARDNYITHQTGTDEPHASNHGLYAGELAIKQKATAHTTAASGKLYYGEDVSDVDSTSSTLRTFGIGIKGDYSSDGGAQTGVPLGGNLYLAAGTAVKATMSTSGDVVTATFDVRADSISDTHLAYDTGQHLTTTSNANFNRVVTNGSYFQTRGTGDAEFYFQGGGTPWDENPNKWKLIAEDVGTTAPGHFAIYSKNTGSYVEAMDLSGIGDLKLAGDLIIVNGGYIGSASDLDAMSIASGGVVTFSQIPVLPANTIDSDHYVDGSIDNAHIADDQINSEHYAAGSIDLEHMSSESVDEDNLYISNSGSNGQFLQKQSGNNGGLTWATPTASISVSDSSANTDFPVVFFDESSTLHDDTGAFEYNPSTGTLIVANLDIGTNVDVDGTLETDALTIGGTNVVSGSLITTLGTVSSGTWQGTAIADGYLSTNTAHLDTTQTFTGAKTFSADAGIIIARGSDTAGNIPSSNLYRAKGSVASPTLVDGDESLGEIAWYGYDGADYEKAASFQVISNNHRSTPASNVMPGSFVWHQRFGSNGSTSESMWLDQYARLQLGNYLESYNGDVYLQLNAAGACASIGGASAGMTAGGYIFGGRADTGFAHDGTSTIWVQNTNNVNFAIDSNNNMTTAQFLWLKNNNNEDTGTTTNLMVLAEDGHLLPGADDAQDIGASGTQWRNAYFDGTLEADAYTVAGTTLAEYISDTVGGMVTGNTETNIAVTYQDGDNTLDFVATGEANVDTDLSITASGSAFYVNSSTGDNVALSLADANNWGIIDNSTYSKISGIEASADVTDTANVTSAGAVMDSEVTNLAFVKALAKGISDGNVLTANDAVADNDFLRINGTEVEGLTVAETLSALGVESGATADQTKSDINALDITELGTVTSGVWQGTAVASAYLDSDTAHLSGTQTFSGTKTFSNTITGSISGNAATVTTNANLTGDVTSSGNATTIATDAVDIAMLSASGTAGSSTFLRGDNTWATPTASISVSDSSANTDFPVVFFDESSTLHDDTGAFEYNPSTGTLIVANLDIGTNVDIDGTLETDALTINGTTSVAFTSSDHSKLDGIEASADVTDSTNVTAAGALMDSECTSLSSVKAMNQGVATSSTPTFSILNVTNSIVPTTNDQSMLGGSSLAFKRLYLADGGEIMFGNSQDIQVEYDSSLDGLIWAQSINDNDLEMFYYADGGEDNADRWRFKWANGGTFSMANYTSGSYVDKFSITAAGDITLGSITSGTWAATDVAVAHGGTGSSNASDARTALGLAIGSNVQAHSSTLDAVSASTYTGDNAIATVGTITSGVWQGTDIASAYIANDAVTLEKMASLTRGSIIIGNSSGNPAALAIGSNDYVLTSDGTDIAWEAASGGGVDTTGTPANNQLAVFTDSDTLEGDSDLTWDGSELYANTTSTGCIAEFRYTGSATSAEPLFKLFKNKTAADDDLGPEMHFSYKNDAGAQEVGANMYLHIQDVSNGNEDTQLKIKTQVGGTTTEILSIGSTDSGGDPMVKPGTNNETYLGSSSKAFKFGYVRQPYGYAGGSWSAGQSSLDPNFGAPTNIAFQGTIGVTTYDVTLASQQGIVVNFDITPVNPSDTRYKENLRDYTNGLSFINSLPTPQIFDYKSTVKTELGCKAVDTDTLGYIAQTLEAVYPDVIQEVDKSYDDDVDDYKTIDYKKFERDTTYALINAVKELKTKNDALEARIAALEGA